MGPFCCRAQRDAAGNEVETEEEEYNDDETIGGVPLPTPPRTVRKPCARVTPPHEEGGTMQTRRTNSFCDSAMLATAASVFVRKVAKTLVPVRR